MPRGRAGSGVGGHRLEAEGRGSGPADWWPLWPGFPSERSPGHTRLRAGELFALRGPLSAQQCPSAAPCVLFALCFRVWAPSSSGCPLSSAAASHTSQCPLRALSLHLGSLSTAAAPRTTLKPRASCIPRTTTPAPHHLLSISPGKCALSAACLREPLRAGVGGCRSAALASWPRSLLPPGAGHRLSPEALPPCPTSCSSPAASCAGTHLQGLSRACSALADSCGSISASFRSASALLQATHPRHFLIGPQLSDPSRVEAQQERSRVPGPPQRLGGS